MIKEKKKALTPYHESEILKAGRYTRIIGIDEVGRGCWAGPVAIGAFIYDYNTPFVDSVCDSKKLSKKQRDKIYSNLAKMQYKVFYGSVREINSIGIGKTIEKIILTAVEKYFNDQTYFLIDGQFSQDFGEHSIKIIKGDSLYYSIAAASILAKVERDKLMDELDIKFPNYGFAKHKGYGTKEHQFNLRHYGASPIHRLNYKPLTLLAKKVID